MIIPNNKFFNQQWGLYLIKVPQAWQALNGGNTVLNGNANEIAFGDANLNLAVVDYGVETKNDIPVHEGFKTSASNGRSKFLNNLVAEGINTLFDFKDFIRGMHGMGVSGVVTSKAQVAAITTYNGRGTVGVAPNVPFYSLVTLNDFRFKLMFMYGLAGLENMLQENTIPYNNALNEAYGLTTDTISISKLFKKTGTTDAGKPLSYFLGGAFTDVFNLSYQSPMDSNRRAENFAKVIMNEISFFGRNGRGSVLVVGAGNDGLDIEPATDQFLNELAYSNKPIIVGAISVDNSYNWLTGTPTPNAKKSNYSNFGNRIDVCAPGGGESILFATTSPGTQDKNLIFTTTVKGSGNFCSDSPLILNLKAKSINTSRVFPSGSPYATTHHAAVDLEFHNVNGIYPDQTLIIGDFTGINTYETYQVFSVAANIVTILVVKQSTYNSLVVSPTLPALPSSSKIEFTPFFTKVITPSTGTIIELESVKGAYVGAEIYIGSLGNTSSGSKRLIAAGGVNITDNKLTLTSAINVNAGDYVLFPTKASKVVTLNASGTKSVVVQNVEGFFVGANIIIESADPINKPFDTGGNITSIDTTTKTINFDTPLFFSPVTPPTGVDIIAKNYFAGDIADDFNGTSAATPFVSGIATLVLSANRNLSSAEVKHIIKESASQTDTVASSSPYTANTEGYQHSPHFGTGLVDAEAAVQLAGDWHTLSTVLKPTLTFFDAVGNTVVADGAPVDSPDIWIKPYTEIETPLPSPTVPFNSFDTTIDQKLFVRVRNTGSRKSFKECDLRVLVAFTDEANPAFPFPEKWFHKMEEANSNNVALLGIKEIESIDPGAERIISFDLKDLQENWSSWNPLNKKAYILAHIAPFDGVETELSLTNLRGNKNLTCRPINVTHFNTYTLAADGTKTPLPKDVYNLVVNPLAASNNVKFEISNILGSRLDALKFTFVMKDATTMTIEQTVIYRKSAGSWSFDTPPTGDWVKIDPTISITDSTLSTPNYKNATLAIVLATDANKEITFDVTN
jgi:hypothetical protein